MPGESPGQQVGFRLPRAHYAVDKVTFALAQGHYPLNLNHVPFVGAQNHYQVEQVHASPPQEHHPRSLSKLSGRSEVDLCSRYIWTSHAGGSTSELSGRSDIDLGSLCVWTSRTHRSLSALSSCSNLCWWRIWRLLTWVPYSRCSPPLIWGPWRY